MKLETITKEKDGYTIRIHVHHDEHMGTPWEEHDGHGVVSDWTSRDKKPGELILCSARNSYRYYDTIATAKLAKKDGWGWLPAKLETGRDEPDTDNMAGWARCGKYYAHHSKNFNRAIESVYAQHRKSMTPKEYIAGAVRKDYEYLRAWCNDEWQWLGYTSEIETPEGFELKGDSCWGIDDREYLIEEAMSAAESTIGEHQAKTRETAERNELIARETALAECCP